MMYWILTTPRSGSTFVTASLSQRLGKTARAMELFNKEFIGRKTDFAPDKDAPVGSYIKYLMKNRSSGILGIKVLYNQIEMFAKYCDFASLIAGSKIVYLQRSNVVKQAISLYIATQTQQWTSSPNRPAAREVSQIDYSFSSISKAVARMELHNSRLRRFFLVNELQHLSITYEDFAKDPAAASDRVIDYLGLEKLETAPQAKKRYEKQATSMNEEFYNKFISEERSRYFGDGSYLGPPLFRESQSK
jgi:trehalose 2-sulfotransferase